jgi:hypothetical protein
LIAFWSSPSAVPLSMLRLRPSELTLTSDDIEETFRRMARRQKPIAPPYPPDRLVRQPGRPILRRGPQRSVRDAYTTLGNIPTLRPQPHQAIHTSVDEDLEDLPVPPRERADSGPGSIVTSPTQRTPVISHGLQLPVRSRHSPRTSNIGDTGFTPTDIFEDAESLESFLSVPAGIGTPEHPGFASGSTDSSDAENDVATRNPPALRGGGSQQDRNSTGALDNDTPHTPLPSKRRQTRASSRQLQNRSQTSDGESPTVYLQGYFTNETDILYHFEETVAWPQTEPCRRNGRSSLNRSVSASSAPVFPLPTQSHPTSNAPQGPSWNAAISDSPATSTQALSNIFGRRGSSSFSTRPDHTSYIPSTDDESSREPRRFGSGTSSASLAYSYYELPDRSSSGDHSLSQYDGNAGSRISSRGAYHSIRTADIQACHDLLRPLPSRNSSYSSPSLSAAAHRAVSPLPAPPYARTQNTPQTFNALEYQTDRSRRDAAIAAIQGGLSPLDRLTDRLGRLAQDQDARRMQALQPFHRQDEIITEQRIRIIPSRHQAEHMHTAQQRSEPTVSSWNNRLHYSEDDPYARGSMAHRQLQHSPVGNSRASVEHPGTTPCHTTQLRSGFQGTRHSPAATGSALRRVRDRSHTSAERGHVRYVFLMRLRLYPNLLVYSFLIYKSLTGMALDIRIVPHALHHHTTDKTRCRCIGLRHHAETQRNSPRELSAQKYSIQHARISPNLPSAARSVASIPRFLLNHP